MGIGRFWEPTRRTCRVCVRVREVGREARASLDNARGCFSGSPNKRVSFIYLFPYLYGQLV